MDTRTYDRVMGAVIISTTRVHKVVHRITGGRVGRRFPGGAVVVWLTVPGRKSGEPRSVPLLSARDDVTGAWIVAGSNVGRTTMPVWVHNVRAADTGTLEVDGVQRPVRIEEVTDPAERGRCYGRLIGVWRWFAGYAERTASVREIPVFRLHPLAPPEPR